MKKIPVLFFLSFLLPFYHYAQVRFEKHLLNTNLFKEFTSGTVLMKDGRVESALLNYDTENQSIIFKKNDQVLILTDLSSVDTVYIQHKKFVSVDNTFYEVVPGTAPVGLYITYSNKKKQLMASPDQTGITKQTGNLANNNVANAYVSRPNQLNYTVEVSNHYWLKRGNNFYKCNNESQLTKVFPLKDREVINSYIKENRINFNETTDVVKLVIFCNSQKK